MISKRIMLATLLITSGLLIFAHQTYADNYGTTPLLFLDDDELLDPEMRANNVKCGPVACQSTGHISVKFINDLYNIWEMGRSNDHGLTHGFVMCIGGELIQLDGPGHSFVCDLSFGTTLNTFRTYRLASDGSSVSTSPDGRSLQAARNINFIRMLLTYRYPDFFSQIGAGLENYQFPDDNDGSDGEGPLLSASWQQHIFHRLVATNSRQFRNIDVGEIDAIKVLLYFSQGLEKSYLDGQIKIKYLELGAVGKIDTGSAQHEIIGRASTGTKIILIGGQHVDSFQMILMAELEGWISNLEGCRLDARVCLEVQIPLARSGPSISFGVEATQTIAGNNYSQWEDEEGHEDMIIGGYFEVRFW